MQQNYRNDNVNRQRYMNVDVMLMLNYDNWMFDIGQVRLSVDYIIDVFDRSTAIDQKWKIMKINICKYQLFTCINSLTDLHILIHIAQP